MHATIADHPEYSEFTKARERAAVDRDNFRVMAEKRQKAFEAASLHAFETAGTIPDAPQNPQAGETAYVTYYQRCRQLDAAEAAWFEANAAELESALLAAEDAIVGRAAEILVELDEMVAELGEIRGCLAKTHRAAGGGFAMPASTGVTLGLLLESARRDTRMLRPPFTPDFAANRVGVLGVAG